MVEYAKVRLDSGRDNDGNYFASPAFGGFYFRLIDSMNLNLRDRQPIRIWDANWNNKGIRDASGYVSLDFDLLPGKIEGKLPGGRLPEGGAIILKDPKQNDVGTHFMLIARNKDDIKRCVNDLMRPYMPLDEYGWGDLEVYDNHMGRAGTRGFTEGAIWPINDRMFSLDVEWMVSVQKGAPRKWPGFKNPIAQGIDDAVLRLLVDDYAGSTPFY